MQKSSYFNLSSLIQWNREQKIVSLPLQFQYLPVDILSKQFTKLNSPHQYRIHYLGPRFPDSHLLHKKYSSSGGNFKKNYSSFDEIYGCSRYQISMKKIIQSHFITEKLKNNHYYKSAIYYRAFEGMNPSLDLSQQYQFNSAFQGGNLDCVIKIKPNEFDLFLRIDSNTRGHLQWFHFSVKNNQKLEKITFHLCNISKSGTLYENGMKPFVFSRRKFQEQGKQWEQNQFQSTFNEKPLRYNIIYQRINIDGLHQLTFQYEFKYQNDEVYFAYCIPYTYSRLLKDIQLLPQQYVRKQTLGRSLTGVDIPILHISNHQQQGNKKNVLITGRIHPGQSNSSHVLLGFVNFLCSDAKQAKQLRNRVNFLIIPMINPDGVIMGNSRSSAAGKDLNRQYKSSNQELFPEVCLVKNLVYKIKKKYGLMFYLDFHGHSRKKNTFFYGPTYTVSESEYYKCRIFPKLVEKIANTFRFYSCSFNISEQKKSTARGVLFEQFKIPYTYTVQSSIGFYYDSQQKITYPFNQQSWQLMGSYICKGFSQYVVHMQEFQQLIIERRLERKRARQKKQIDKKLNKKFVQDEQVKQVKPYKQSLFLQMIEQIKANSNNKNLDIELSSDDHDEHQDFQISKFMEFNNLVSGKKDKYDEKPTMEGLNGWDIKIKQVNQQKDELLIIKQIDEEKPKKIQKEKPKLQRQGNVFVRLIQNQNKKLIIPKIKKQSMIQRRTSYQNKRTYYRNLQKQQGQKMPITNFTQQKRKQKKYNKEDKRIVIVRDFFPEPTCQVLQLPKYSQSSFFKRQIKYTQPIKIVKPHCSNKAISKQKQYPIYTGKRYSNSIGQSQSHLISNMQPRPLESNISQRQKSKWKQKIENSSKKYPFYQSCLMSIQQNLSDIKGKIDLQHMKEYINAETLDIDNMAMTIKSFNK